MMPVPVNPIRVRPAPVDRHWLGGKRKLAVIHNEQGLSGHQPKLGQGNVSNSTEEVRGNPSRSRADAVRAVLRDFARTCTLHGIGFVGDDRIGTVERCMWILAVLFSGMLMSYLCWAQWVNYVNAPTQIKIEQNDLPTNSFPFPAVTFCTKTRLKMNVLDTQLQRYLEAILGNRSLSLHQNHSEWQKMLHGIGQTLTNYQFPQYRLMQPGLVAVGRLLPFLDGLSISRVMMQGRFTCKDLLARCYWRGVYFDCCKEFQLQRTAMGYCLSFNSRTHTGPKILCSKKNCHHVWSTGPGTGLVVVFKLKTHKKGLELQKTVLLDHYLQQFIEPTASALHFKQNKKLGNAEAVWMDEELFLGVQSSMMFDHVLVMVQSRQVFPDVTRHFAFSNRQRNDFSISMAVSYDGTASDLELKRRLQPKDRHCLFHGEVTVQTARYYSQRECIAECKNFVILKRCGCRPYFFESYEGVADYTGPPECRFTQLPCLSAINLNAINCNHCLPECDFARYSARIYRSINGRVRDDNLGSTIEISYDVLQTAVLYRRQLAFGDLEMLVAIGGLVSLCLGCSILTGLDMLQMLLRVLKAAFDCHVEPIYQTTRLNLKDDKTHLENYKVKL